MIRVHGVGVVERNQERRGQRLIIFVVVKFQGVSDAPQNVFEKIATRALQGLTAHFFVVEARRHAYPAAFPVRGQRFQRGTDAREIVDSGRSEKLAVSPEYVGHIGIDEIQIVGNDLLLGDSA